MKRPLLENQDITFGVVIVVSFLLGQYVAQSRYNFLWALVGFWIGCAVWNKTHDLPDPPCNDNE